MACITISLDKSDKMLLERFSWMNWSDVAREEANKKDIFERYLKTGEVTDEDWEFCERVDWHPVDELPEKEEFRKQIEEAKKEPRGKVYSSADEFFKDLDSR